MHFQLPSKGAVRRLGHVPSTLLIPLAARAHGAKLFPDWDPHDRCAAAQLQRCGVQVQDLESTLRKQVGTVFTNVNVNAAAASPAAGQALRTVDSQALLGPHGRCHRHLCRHLLRQ